MGGTLPPKKGKRAPGRGTWEKKATSGSEKKATNKWTCSYKQMEVKVFLTPFKKDQRKSPTRALFPQKKNEGRGARWIWGAHSAAPCGCPACPGPCQMLLWPPPRGSCLGDQKQLQATPGFLPPGYQKPPAFGFSEFLSLEICGFLRLIVADLGHFSPWYSYVLRRFCGRNLLMDPLCHQTPRSRPSNPSPPSRP